MKPAGTLLSCSFRSHCSIPILPCVLPVTVVGCLILGCSGETASLREQTVLRGYTMGTTYTVKIVHSSGSASPKGEIRTSIHAELDRVNRLMSTYDPESELSRFNVSSSTEPFRFSPETVEVLELARDLFVSTGGAFDPTVEPLVELWGFGPVGRRGAPPTNRQIRDRLASVGMNKLVFNPDGTVRKQIPSLKVDLSAVAKGYGVDRVALLLEKKGFTDFMVEIGGEVRVRGKNRRGIPWRLGIDSPEQTPGARRLIHTLSLTDRAVATSGDYRNSFVFEGVRYSHVICPQTGRPVPESVKSVSVVASSCARADGAATAIMVLGATRGLQWAENQEDLEALLIVKSAGGALDERWTSRMKGFVLQ